MTVITYDGKSIAADRQWVSGDEIMGYRSKLTKYSGGYWTSCGRISDAELFRQWLEGEIEGFKPRRDFGSLYTKDGKVYEIDHSMVPVEAFVPSSLGDGRRVALGAMLDGYTAKEAAQLACKVNVWCGGKVDVVDV